MEFGNPLSALLSEKLQSRGYHSTLSSLPTTAASNERLQENLTTRHGLLTLELQERLQSTLPVNIQKVSDGVQLDVIEKNLQIDSLLLSFSEGKLTLYVSDSTPAASIASLETSSPLASLRWASA